MNFNAATNKTVLDRYLALKQPDNITQCMYVWIDGTGEHLRAKAKTVKFVPKKPAELPIWNYDGSSTGQAEGKNSDTWRTGVPPSGSRGTWPRRATATSRTGGPAPTATPTPSPASSSRPSASRSSSSVVVTDDQGNPNPVILERISCLI